MSDNFISLQDISGELSRLRADKAALQRRVEELEEARAVLFDGYSVYRELSDKQRQYTTEGSVSAVLDAVMKIQKRQSLNSTKEAK